MPYHGSPPICCRTFSVIASIDRFWPNEFRLRMHANWPCFCVILLLLPFNSKTRFRYVNLLLFFSASIFPAIFIMAATYAECNHLLVVTFFTLSIGLNAFMPSGLLANPIDLSPNYAGTIMSIGNAVGALCGIIAPFTVGLLTPNVSGGVVASGELFTILFGYLFNSFCFVFLFWYPEGVFIRMALGILDHIHDPFNQNCDILNVRFR